MLSHRMTRFRLRVVLALCLMVGAAGAISACGEQGISLSASEGSYRPAARLFDERCSGCHTLGVAGTQGSATNIRTREYKDGPNFNQRKETYQCILYAIRNGGFSSGPMPQNLVDGEQAQELARFITKFSGADAARAGSPSTSGKPAADCPSG